MEPADPEVAAYIAQWGPSSLSPRAAVFARDVVARTAPAGRDRAKNLPWAAGKLAGYDGSDWPRHDGLKWPHPSAVVAAGMVVSA